MYTQCHIGPALYIYSTQAQCLACNKNTIVLWCRTPEVDLEK